MLKLSHISCRVDNLYEVAKQVEEMGFTIEWGGLPGKENNFFIWFGEEAFLEVFCIKRKFAPLVVAMQLVYGTVPAKKWWRWFKVKMNSDYALSLDDIHDYEKIYGKIPKGAFVAMRSDWGKRWPSQEKFQNMDEYGEQHYPGWSLEAVKYLIEKRDVTAIGHETFDTDPPFCKEQRYFQAECYVLKQDRYQIEMLTNLDKIPERGAIIFCIFVKQTNGTGFPVRCFAICPNK